MRACFSASISKRLRPALLGTGLAALLAGCAGSNVPIPTDRDVEYAGRNGQATTLKSMILGRRYYIQRCSACHNLEKPLAWSAGEWPKLVEKRAADAELNPEQKRLITQYLVGVAAAAQDSSGAALAPQSTTQARRSSAQAK